MRRGTPTGAAPDGSNRPLPERIAELDNEREAIELHGAGHTLRQIAALQSCSVSTAHARVQRGWKRLAPIQEAEVWRARQNDQMDAQEQALLRRLADHNTGAASLTVTEHVALDGALVRLHKRRAELNGLDVPVTQKIEVVSQWEAEIEQLAQELAGEQP